ncbi:tyrosine-type recombinase/integrase [uncultured Cellulomonas sp.]|uniref:tyrosine-type recombinase/integrase n=1 Tax=uncultured Cellulomonas sp. TaxID=189682 RepID=UPI0028E45158|nr:tyrosine-type recombinase/integrase [uncultured Cellulomonas sp.]
MAERRAPGEASVYREGNVWRGQVDLGRGIDGKRRRKKLTGRTRAEVVLKIRALQQDIATNKAPKSQRLTVAAFLDRWVNLTLPGSVADSTLDSYANTVRLHIRPALGHHVLSQLTVQHVDELLAGKRAAGYKPSSVVLMRTVLRRALKTAEREGLVDRNVAGLSTPPRLRRAPGRTLTIDEAHRLLDEIQGHRLEALFILMLTFGLRRGEALGLKWANLDSTRLTLRVTHGVKRVKNHRGGDNHRTMLVLGELKTARAVRTLYLSPDVVTALERHRERQDNEREHLGRAWTETGLVFTSEVGTMLDPDNVSRVFSRLARQAGLGHWHAHELRHSGASLMLTGGTPLHVVSEVLGHASIAITKDVYGHLAEGEKRGAAETMSNLLRRVQEGH